MAQPGFIFVCNALDDHTRRERNIVTDSPAASRKILLTASALRMCGVRSFVISFGRGRADGSLRWHRSCVKRINGVIYLYAPFCNIPILSEIVSVFGVLPLIARLRLGNDAVLLFYNRLTAYIPTIIWSNVLGYRCFLDLEDGEVDGKNTASKVSKFSLRLKRTFFDFFCHHGSLVACNELQGHTGIRPAASYYGTIEDLFRETHFASSTVTCLMSGSLSEDTGALVLIEAIRLLRTEGDNRAGKLRFEICGKGDRHEDFVDIAGFEAGVDVVVHERLTDIEYARLVARCDVGLALKTVNGPLANTTFPSKVIEFACNGLLILSTDISDVRVLFGNGARYLSVSDPSLLRDELLAVVDDIASARSSAIAGQQRIKEKCCPESTGPWLKKFFYGE
jgi:glycosyltransferase involved in cell wall biosynthesis